MLYVYAYLQVIKLDVTHLDIEPCSSCACDYLAVYNGADQEAPLLEHLCGSTTTTAYSKYSNMFLKFVSDHIIDASGFRATVKFLPLESK